MDFIVSALRDYAIGGVVGLLIGWNVLPQPVWVSKLWAWTKDKLTKKDV